MACHNLSLDLARDRIDVRAKARASVRVSVRSEPLLLSNRLTVMIYDRVSSYSHYNES